MKKKKVSVKIGKAPNGDVVFAVDRDVYGPFTSELELVAGLKQVLRDLFQKYPDLDLTTNSALVVQVVSQIDLERN